jgi:hypothetical protein
MEVEKSRLYEIKSVCSDGEVGTAPTRHQRSTEQPHYAKEDRCQRKGLVDSVRKPKSLDGHPRYQVS